MSDPKTPSTDPAEPARELPDTSLDQVVGGTRPVRSNDLGPDNTQRK